MIFELDPTDIAFPDPSYAEDDGLIAIGGDLSPDRLLNAYANGIFPWYDDDSPILWWSLDPRMVLFPRHFRYSKSLQRTVKSKRYEVRVDSHFEQVIRACANSDRERQQGTWITEQMIEAYVRLHKLGFAHSFETYYQGELVGGLYGVSLGDLFFGESMFHTMPDASKVAFVRLVAYCQMHGFRLIDAQQETAHLASLGAQTMSREAFLSMLGMTDWTTTIRGRWGSHTAVLLIGGNQGDRHALIDEAVKKIKQKIGKVTLISPIYETKPWGFTASQDFLNQALIVDTNLDAHAVLHRALEIEKELGRQRHTTDTPPTEHKVYHSRPMDIDMIFYDSLVLDTPDLQLPHPRMHLRRFVLQPLCDLIPTFEHPTLHHTLQHLLTICPDEAN